MANDRSLPATLREAIEWRRSARSFTAEPIADDIIAEMLCAVQLAPSGGNRQTHMIGVVRDPARKQALAEAAGGQMWIADAPVVFACCARLEDDPRGKDDSDFWLQVNSLRSGRDFMQYLLAYPEWRYMSMLLADGDCLIPIEHILLTAATHGLKGCPVGYLDVQKASQLLCLPDDVVCQYLLPVGYPAQPAPAKKLKSIEEISFSEVYAPRENG